MSKDVSMAQEVLGSLIKLQQRLGRLSEALSTPEKVFVREQVEGKWGSYALTDLPVDIALKHVVRFIQNAQGLEEKP